MFHALEYQFSLAVTEPPTGNQLRFDHPEPELVTKVWARYITNPGEDAYPVLMRVPPGTQFYVQDYDDHTKYVQLRTTGWAVDKPANAYVELPVAYLASGASLAGQKAVVWLITPSEGGTEPPLPGPGLPALATLDDLKALGVTGDPEDLTRLLDAASAAARAWCGWIIAPTQYGAQLPGRYAGKATTLPTLWLKAVQTVLVDSSPVDPVPPWLASGLLQLAISPYSQCLATVDHGYDLIPADVSMAVAGMVSRAVSAPAGVTSERLGMWSVSYGRGALTVDPAAAEGLAPYRLPSVP